MIIKLKKATDSIISFTWVNLITHNCYWILLVLGVEKNEWLVCVQQQLCLAASSSYSMHKLYPYLGPVQGNHTILLLATKVLLKKYPQGTFSPLYPFNQLRPGLENTDKSDVD